MHCTLPEAQVSTVTTTTTNLQYGGSVVDVVERVGGSTPTASIMVGTPAKPVNLIFDTGSDKLVLKTWATVEKTLDSVDPGLKGMLRDTPALYNNAGSSTYKGKFKVKQGKKKPLRYFITYGSGSAMTLEGEDAVAVGSRVLDKFPISEIIADSLALLHTKEKIFGIMGLMHMKNRSYGESVFSRLRDIGALSSFGYCLADVKNNIGAFIWGDSQVDGTEVPVPGVRHWAVQLKGVRVDTPPEAPEVSDDWTDAAANSSWDDGSGDGDESQDEGFEKGKRKADRASLKPPQRKRRQPVAAGLLKEGEEKPGSDSRGVPD